MAKKSNANRLHELVFFRIFDVGRAINLPSLQKSLAVREEGPTVRAPSRRDTPASLSLPRPLLVPLKSAASEGYGTLKAEAKVYEDGAITVCLRLRVATSLAGLETIAGAPIVRADRPGEASGSAAPGETITLSAWADRLFGEMIDLIRPAILDPASNPGKDFETYIAFCMLECPEGPERYVEKNRTAIASLMMGAPAGEEIHEQKIAETLAKPFSYAATDMAVFDLDRCFIIDPRGEYEDILLMIEHANYRLLELRVLDRLLDKRLDEAERDLGSFSRRGRAPVGAVRKKFARIQSLRFVALFVLENLENSSKIIGDYYLGQIYDRLCALFNTDGWSRSVERRLDILTSVYEMVKTDNAERRTLVLEIVFIAVCIILPVIQIWQALL